MTEPYEIVRTVRIDAPVDRVFGLLTDPVLLRSGLVYTWDWENEPMGVDTTVEFVLEPDGDGTVVRLRHTGFPQPDWVDSHARGSRSCGRHGSWRARRTAPGVRTT